MRRTFIPLVSLVLAACTAAPDAADEMCAEGDDKCDKGDSAAASTACDSSFVDMSGRSAKVKPGSLNDAVSKFIFKAGKDCPTNLVDIAKKFKDQDKKGCDAGGLVTRLVSERSQIRGVADTYRAVTTRQCDDRDEHDLMFSTFGLTPSGDLPDAVEVIALDKTKGVFNYYAVEDGKWNYHGSSVDLLKGPGDGGKRRCAGCHIGGGLVMKELESPWMHWEGDTDTAGSDELIAKHAEQFGTKSDGINMEQVVRSGNEVWKKARLAEVKKGGLKEVLRPVFCTREINLANGTSSTSPVSNAKGDSELTDFPTEFYIGSHAGGVFTSVAIEGPDYRAQVAANGQRMSGGGSATLKDKAGKAALDTIFDFAFVKQAAIDSDYIDFLVEQKIIDEDFVHDLYMVDFTRPVFSTDRCALLEKTPDLAVADMKAAKVRDGFIAALGSPSASSAAGVFLANLKAASDGDKHDEKLEKFFTACNARDKKEIVADTMKINSLRRNQARKLQILEFPETLPFDDLTVDEASRLSPKTCEIVTSFVAP